MTSQLIDDLRVVLKQLRDEGQVTRYAISRIETVLMKEEQWRM